MLLRGRIQTFSIDHQKKECIMKIIFNKKFIAVILASVSVCTSANSVSDYIILTEPSYLLLSLLGCGLLALRRLRHI